MLTSVSLPTLLGRNFKPSALFHMIAPNIVSNSWRRLSRNGRNKCRQYIFVCLRVVSYGLPLTASWAGDRCHCPSNADHLYSRLVDFAVYSLHLQFV